MKLVLAIVLSLFAIIVLAQDMEETVVTGMRDDYDSDAIPSVTLTRRADFLVQNIRLVNDSRSPDLRRTEIMSTIQNLLKRAEGMRGMALSYGEGFLEPIDLGNDSLELIEDRQRIDTSYVDIYAKVALDPDRTAKVQIGDLRDFVAGVKKAGRTEILPLGDIGLSIVGPEHYRYDIIRKIAAERTQISDAMQADCDYTIQGLEGRVQWQRSSVSELTLYIPYRLKVSDCMQGQDDRAGTDTEQ